MTDATFTQTVSADSHDHHAEGDVSTRAVVLFLLFVAVVIAAVVYGMFAIGPWVLGITALALVPVIYVVLMILTVGK